MISLRFLADVDEPIYLNLLKVNEWGEASLLSCCKFDWRQVR